MLENEKGKMYESKLSGCLDITDTLHIHWNYNIVPKTLNMEMVFKVVVITMDTKYLSSYKLFDIANYVLLLFC